MQIVFEDNHLLAINKLSGEIVQGDITNDRTILDDARAYLREKYDKKGNVYIGLPHRLDRPTSGLLLLAKTDKALTRLNSMFQKGEIKKTYIAITDSSFQDATGTLRDYIIKNEKDNKSYIVKEGEKNSKYAELEYNLLSKSDNYYLYKILLKTGRHHQIRCQFSQRGIHIKGDLKYGARRSNPDGSISLHSYKMQLLHPVKREELEIIAHPSGRDWDIFKGKI